MIDTVSRQDPVAVALAKAQHEHRRRRSLMEAPELQVHARVMGLDELVKIARRAFEELKDPELQTWIAAGHRVHTTDWRIAVSTITGTMTAEQWARACKANVIGAIRDLNAHQPNGKWRLADVSIGTTEVGFPVEVETEDGSGGLARVRSMVPVPYLEFFCVLIDEKNAEQMRYRGGRPVSDADLAQFSPELVELFRSIAQPQPQPQRSESAEIAQLRALLEAQQEQIAALVAASGRPATASGRPSTPRRGRRTAATSADPEPTQES